MRNKVVPWYAVLKEELTALPNIAIPDVCSLRVTEELWEAVRAVKAAVTEARVKRDRRLFYLYAVGYGLLQALAMCEEGLGVLIAGKTPEEVFSWGVWSEVEKYMNELLGGV